MYKHFLADKEKIPIWRNSVTYRAPRSTQKTSNYIKKINYFCNIRMLNLTLNELKLVAKSRGIKDYENKSEDDLIKILSEPKTKTSLSKKKIRDIRKDFNKSRYKFSKSKIKEIRKNLYNIKNPKNLSESKIKEIEKNLFELEESLSRYKKHYNYDDTEYIGIRDIGNLFNQSIDEDYYKPIKTKSAFNGNYIEYESKGDKDKIYQLNTIV